MWIFTAEGLLGFLAGGSKEKAVPEREVMFPQELRRMAALPRATEVSNRSGLFMYGLDLVGPLHGARREVLSNCVLRKRNLRRTDFMQKI
jgi:hypothetical protein